jgi:galactokinase
MAETQTELEASFQRKFGTILGVYRAPGRVNLIGEHTDYNQGFVLPAAVNFSCWVAAGPRTDNKLGLFSENFVETVELDLGNLTRSKKWHDYPAGVAWTLAQAGCSIKGVNLGIDGDVPLGAGLSSSAALEVAVGYALLDVFHCDLDLTRLALLCQQAENDFVGARVGVMDQFIACYGREGHALLLDCRSLEHSLVPLPAGTHLVVCNTMVKHQIATSGYNTRRKECEEGVRLLSRRKSGITSLRDVQLADLERSREVLPEVIYRRCRHVITENERVLQAAEALRKGEFALLGRLMFESHRSMRDDYEISCPELDIMVEIASEQQGVIGARMTGGGFGGCTVNLVRAESSELFRERVAAAYQAKTRRHPEIYLCEASRGVERIR